MTLTLATWRIGVIFLTLHSISFAAQPPIYQHYSSDDILHIDVYQENLGAVVAYINEHFSANITLDREIQTELISVRCESKWLNIVFQICAQENLEIFPSNRGWHIRKKSTHPIL